MAPDLIRLQSYRSVYGYVAVYPRRVFCVAVSPFHPLLLGGNPLTAPSLYVLIHYLEREWGIHYAMGGTGAVVAGLARLFDEMGGKLHLNSEVQEIPRRRPGPTGNRCPAGRWDDPQRRRRGLNADVAWTYMNLIPARYRRKNSDGWVKRKKYSMSLFVIYFGTKRRYSEPGTPTGDRLAHHNIILSDDYKGLLREIFANHDLPEDFAALPARAKQDRPIDGAARLRPSVLCPLPVPHLDADIDWTSQAKPYRDAIISGFWRTTICPICRPISSPSTSSTRCTSRDGLNSYLGSAFSVQPTLLPVSLVPPAQPVRGLRKPLLCRCGTHPGAGLPGVLASGKIAADLIGGVAPLPYPLAKLPIHQPH